MLNLHIFDTRKSPRWESPPESIKFPPYIKTGKVKRAYLDRREVNRDKPPDQIVFFANGFVRTSIID
jgi:hypothetical protein